MVTAIGSPIPDDACGDGTASIYSWVKVQSEPPNQISNSTDTRIIATGRNRGTLSPVRINFAVFDEVGDVEFNGGEGRWKCAIVLPPKGIAPENDREGTIRAIPSPSTSDPVLTLQREWSMGNIPESRAMKQILLEKTFGVTVV
jgi:hypothetical protein